MRDAAAAKLNIKKKGHGFLNDMPWREMGVSHVM
jgi:hypothetical protein